MDYDVDLAQIGIIYIGRSRLFRGEIDKYTWIDVGSSFLPSDILAAFLYAQLRARERIQAHRKKVWEVYNESLRDWAKQRGVKVLWQCISSTALSRPYSRLRMNLHRDDTLTQIDWFIINISYRWLV